MKPFAEESRFWHALWSSAGKPRSGELFAIMKCKKSQYKMAIRRLKRCTDIINNDKLLESLLKKDKCIFKVVKSLRKKSSGYSSHINDQSGPENIANLFSGLYMKLYNNVSDNDDIDLLTSKVEDKIDISSLDVVNRIDVSCVKSAVQQMKSKKRDSTYDVTSDMYKSGPDIFFDHLSTILRQSLLHGALPHIVLLCTLTPLLKDSLGDITKSDNYRAIAGGCLLLKVLDLVVLNMESCKLSTDALQFAYKANTGTSMCTWTVTAVVDFFTRNGNPVYGAALDMSKAFDMVKWDELFTTLMKRNVEPIFLRLLMYIYSNQQYTVKWGNHLASCFSVNNGVRQGGVSSGVFFAIYIDELLQLLRKSGFGCAVRGVFLGAVIYADDIFLLSASRTGLQHMINICHNYATMKNLKFGTNVNPDKSKTKCIIFSKKKIPEDVLPVTLDGNTLPWVKQVQHLGHTLQSDNSMTSDINQKRRVFIGKINSLLQEFHYSDSNVLLKLAQTYACNVYGSNVWNLFSPTCSRLFTIH